MDDLDCMEIKTVVVWDDAIDPDTKKEKANREKLAQYTARGCGTCNFGTITYEKMQISMYCAYCKDETCWYVKFPSTIAGHIWGVCPTCVGSLHDKPFVGNTGVKGLTWVSKM